MSAIDEPWFLVQCIVGSGNHEHPVQAWKHCQLSPEIMIFNDNIHYKGKNMYFFQSFFKELYFFVQWFSLNKPDNLCPSLLLKDHGCCFCTKSWTQLYSNCTYLMYSFVFILFLLCLLCLVFQASQNCKNSVSASHTVFLFI